MAQFDNNLRLYHVVGDEADVELSNKFHVERERERWKN